MAKKKLKDTDKDKKPKTDTKVNEAEKTDDIKNTKEVKNEIIPDLVTKPMVIPDNKEITAPETVKSVSMALKKEAVKERLTKRKKNL